DTADLPLAQLIRARCDQVLYRPAPPRTGKPGAPRKDGDRFQGRDPTTHGVPDADWSGQDAHGQVVQVTCWSGLHLRKARQVPITVVRMIRTRARGTKRDPRESWFWWLGEPLPALVEVAGLYPRRYGQEHGYRFDKQDLLWATPRVRTPAQPLEQQPSTFGSETEAAVTTTANSKPIVSTSRCRLRPLTRLPLS